MACATTTTARAGSRLKERLRDLVRGDGVHPERIVPPASAE